MFISFWFYQFLFLEFSHQKNLFILTFKVLLIKAGGLIIVAATILYLLGGLLNIGTPYYWASPKFEHKLNILESDSSINTLFIGSSYTINGVNPMLFDSLLNHKVKSYNLAIPLGIIPESYYWLDNFLDNIVKSKKRPLTVFVEFNRIHPVAKFENNDRFYYMLDSSSFHILWKFINAKYKSLLSRLKLKKKLLLGFFKNQFGIDLLGKKIKYYFFGSKNIENDNFEKFKGYVPSFEELNSKDKKALKKYMAKVRRGRESGELELSYLKNYTQALINKASLNNVNLIFYITPSQIEPSLWQLSQTLKFDQVLDFGHPDSELFDLTNRKNVGHLNDRGANILTKLFAEECIKRDYFE